MKRFWPVLFGVLPILLFPTTFALAQSAGSIETLRSSLRDVQEKEAAVQARMKQLDEDLKPESIAAFFALNGSTHPEELREQRRRSLETQKAGLQTQLDQLGASRARLEASIATVEAAAYRQSASPYEANPPSSLNSSSNPPSAKPKQTKRRVRPQRVNSRRRRG